MASGGTKRPSSDSDGGPAPKKPALLIPTLDLGPVTGEEDLGIKVLKVIDSHSLLYMYMY